MLIFSKYLFFSTFNALAVWPFIFLKEKELKNNMILLNHENIHLHQQKELLWLFFFLFYLIEFIVKLIIYKQPKIAYFNLSFEREAYQNEHNLDYVRQRRVWNFLKYL
ncbi:MAG: hypothetical protein OEM04_00125 [Flavobacteriaceae bacterium]|nr:hypothetical protein [Flavobacteriaceae bacterium]